MKKIRMTIELTYDDKLMHDGDKDIDAKEWFFKDILQQDRLILHSNEIGEGVGEVKILEIK